MGELHPPWDVEVVKGVADVLADTDHGMTGSEIGRLLADLTIPDPLPRETKRIRLRHALLAKQQKDGAANGVIAFVTRSMAPVLYRDNPALWTLRHDSLNEVLVYEGLRVNDEGKIQRGQHAATLSDAAQHANNLRAELRRRGTHPDVLRYCTTELLQKNAFHAMLEATKSVFDKIRFRTGLTEDGAKLIDQALAVGQSGPPKLSLNSLASPTDKSEQRGFVNLLTGLAGMFRNPVAHDPRLNRTVTDEELLEVLTTLSMVHRRLDAARLRP
ncbi:TIGR02391 family protein [Kibdelosporangium aridum]|uniref:TIGR02391 family protein n=1 Tax=Kibdelosporangium aridum TaxID=2030 RepID=UPI0005277E60